MIPYYVCSIIHILIKLPLQGRIASELSWQNILFLPIYAVDQYWFLYILFIYYALMAFLEWKIKNPKPIAGFALGLWLAVRLMYEFLPDSVLWYLQMPVRTGEFFLFFFFGARLRDWKYKATALQGVGCGVIFFDFARRNLFRRDGFRFRLTYLSPLPCDNGHHRRYIPCQYPARERSGVAAVCRKKQYVHLCGARCAVRRHPYPPLLRWASPISRCI